MVVRSTTGVYVKPDSVLAHTAREMVEAHFGGSGPRDGVTVCPTCGDPLPCAAGRAAAEVLAAAGLAQTSQASGLVQAARQGLPAGAGAPPSPLGQASYGPASPGLTAHQPRDLGQPPQGRPSHGQAHVGLGPVGQPPFGQQPFGTSAPDNLHHADPGRSGDAAADRSPDDRLPSVQPQGDRPRGAQPPPAPPVSPGRRSRAVGDQAIDRPGPEQPSLGRPYETNPPAEPADGPAPFGRRDEAPQERPGPAAAPTFKGWAEINRETAAQGSAAGSGHPMTPPARPQAPAARDGHGQSGPAADRPPVEPGQFGGPGAFGRGDESGQFAQAHPAPQDYRAQPHLGGQPDHAGPAGPPDRRSHGGQPFTPDDAQHGGPAPAGGPGTAPPSLNGYRSHGSTTAGAPGRDAEPHAAAPGTPGPSGLTPEPPSWTPGGGVPASEEGTDSPPSGLPRRPDGDGLPPSRGVGPAA
jgi:hypothetical protein